MARVYYFEILRSWGVIYWQSKSALFEIKVDPILKKLALLTLSKFMFGLALLLLRRKCSRSQKNKDCMYEPLFDLPVPNMGRKLGTRHADTNNSSIICRYTQIVRPGVRLLISSIRTVIVLPSSTQTFNSNFKLSFAFILISTHFKLVKLQFYLDLSFAQFSPSLFCDYIAKQAKLRSNWNWALL